MKNLSYKILKELKEAGFPQEGQDWYCSSCKTFWNNGGIEGGLCSFSCKSYSMQFEESDPDGNRHRGNQYYDPNLDEIIEVIGDDFGGLTRSVKGKKIGMEWMAHSESGISEASNIRREATAKLLLALRSIKQEGYDKTYN